MFLFCLFAYFVCDHGYTCAMYGTCVIRSQIHVNAGHRAFEASAIFFYPLRHMTCPGPSDLNMQNVLWTFVMGLF